MKGKGTLTFHNILAIILIIVNWYVPRCLHLLPLPIILLFQPYPQSELQFRVNLGKEIPDLDVIRICCRPKLGLYIFDINKHNNNP